MAMHKREKEKIGGRVLVISKACSSKTRHADIWRDVLCGSLLQNAMLCRYTTTIVTTVHPKSATCKIQTGTSHEVACSEGDGEILPCDAHFRNRVMIMDILAAIPRDLKSLWLFPVFVGFCSSAWRVR